MPAATRYTARTIKAMSVTVPAPALASTITLANNTPIPRLHLGVYQTSGTPCTRAVTHALAAGYRAIDSAAWYHNEREVGAAIAAGAVARADVFFTTKLQSNESFAATKRAVDESLARCGLAWIDLYLLHSPYGGRERRAECWRAVVECVKEGKVRCAGVSNFGVRHLQQLLEDCPEDKPLVNQVEVHPFNTQTQIVEFCQQHHIQIQAYAPLARAMRFRDPTVQALARRYACTPAQLLVRWSLQRGFVALPKSVRRERIVENAHVDGFVIAEADMERMDALDEGLVTDWDPTGCE
ncbi:NADP-dependent oxidoreductase domain-containing protein [Morchella snyderi]|nr:NADP-dependent oxidoreductase domain-containing protein [Morchella snyderi]